MEGIDEADWKVVINEVPVSTFQSTIHVDDESETPQIEGIAPDADFSAQNITINESDGEITGTLTATTVGADSGYFISLDFSAVTSDMSDVVNITYLATDVRSETVDSGSVSDNIATIFVAELDAENILAQTVVIEAVDSDSQVIYQNVYDISAITLGE